MRLLSTAYGTTGMRTDARCSSSVLWCCLQTDTGGWDRKPAPTVAGPPEHPSAHLSGDRCEMLDLIGVQHVGPPFGERVAATPLRLPTGAPCLDLLEEPPVAVRIAERGPGGIGATLRVRACRSSLGSGVMEDSADVVEHLTHDDAAADQLGAGDV